MLSAGFGENFMFFMQPHPSHRTSRRLKTVRLCAGRALLGLTAMGIFLSAAPAQAVSGTWIGTSNELWSGPSNWSSSPSVPGASDTATFDSAGISRPTLVVDGAPAIGSMIINNSAGSYFIGTGSGDVLGLSAGGSISMGSTVGAPQQIGANVNLGTTNGSEAFTFSNSSTLSGAALFFFRIISSGTLTGVKTLTVTGDGNTEIHGGIINGAGSVAVNKTGAGMLSFLPGATLGFQNLTASDGTINVNAALAGGAGTAVVTVTNAAGGAATTLNFGSVSQTLASLTIGAGAKVTFSSGLVGPGGGGESFASPKGALVPEPSTSGLLILGALAALRRRRPV